MTRAIAHSTALGYRAAPGPLGLALQALDRPPMVAGVNTLRMIFG
jgi:hypothetical protein